MMGILTQDLKNLRNAFVKEGFDIRLVGGCVRDHLMMIAPKDVDLCTDAIPDEQISIYENLGLRHIPTGIQHGTITVVLDGVPYEITSLRTETNHDGRHATVSYTRDWVEDLSRRDLTINAMALTFDGKLIDPFSGHSDLCKRRVRFVGSPVERIREDYLRILRWFRFHGRIAGYAELDADTLKSVTQEAAGLTRISRERVWMEMQKIVVGPAGDAMLEAISASGVAKHIGLSTDWCEDASLAHARLRHPITLLSALLGTGVIELACEWKWSNDERDLARYLIESDATSMSDFKTDVAVRGISKEWVSQRAMLMGMADHADVISAWDIPSFPINGGDLMKVGVAPGPKMGETIQTLKKAWAESGFVASKQELLDMIE